MKRLSRMRESRFDKEQYLDNFNNKPTGRDYQELLDRMEDVYNDLQPAIYEFNDELVCSMIEGYPEAEEFWFEFRDNKDAEYHVGALLDYIENELADNSISEDEFYSGTNDYRNLYPENRKRVREGKFDDLNNVNKTLGALDYLLDMRDGDINEEEFGFIKDQLGIYKDQLDGMEYGEDPVFDDYPEIDYDAGDKIRRGEDLGPGYEDFDADEYYSVASDRHQAMQGGHPSRVRRDIDALYGENRRRQREGRNATAEIQAMLRDQKNEEDEFFARKEAEGKVGFFRDDLANKHREEWYSDEEHYIDEDYDDFYESKKKLIAKKLREANLDPRLLGLLDMEKLQDLDDKQLEELFMESKRRRIDRRRR